MTLMFVVTVEMAPMLLFCTLHWECVGQKRLLVEGWVMVDQDALALSKLFTNIWNAKVREMFAQNEGIGYGNVE